MLSLWNNRHQWTSTFTRDFDKTHGSNKLKATLALSTNTSTRCMETMVMGHPHALHMTQQWSTTATTYHMAAASNEQQLDMGMACKPVHTSTLPLELHPLDCLISSKCTANLHRLHHGSMMHHSQQPRIPSTSYPDHQHHRVLPIHQMDKGQDIPTWIADDLLTQLIMAPHQCAETLWHRIRPMAPLNTLCEHIQQWQQLHLCSNASMDAAKHSCCAWIIHTMTDLWHGEGVVPRNWEDNYSGCSKAFGILTAIWLFLQHYTNHFPSL